jgi:RNA polymerase sigma factor (sigma-70 family)
MTLLPWTNLLRDLAPQVLASLMRRSRDFAACEDAVQEALVAAAEQWPGEGVPDNPRGWLIHVAMRRMTDQARAEIARRQREQYVVSLVPSDEQVALAADTPPERDDTLELFFLCCQPGLSPTSAIALTLRAVGGLTTAEIASAFFVPEATMAQRISRAKRTLKDVRFAPLSGAQIAERLEHVLLILYLIFNEGYAVSGGSALLRTDLSNEAIRITRMLHTCMADETEVAGLLSLMLLTDARRPARMTAVGELVPLDEQDRSLWNREAIREGVTLLLATLPRGRVGAYQLQAAIAAVHDEAPSTEGTDWTQILALYGMLRRVADSPMAALNEAVAVAMVHGPREGLDRLDGIHGLGDSHRVDAVRAHLLERAGDSAGAIECYRRAAGRTANKPEQIYLLMRAAKLEEKYAR